MAEPTTEQWQSIQAALFAGRKIQAIKLYREATDAGLAEAKEAMDAYELRLRNDEPDRFAASASKSGCTSMILLSIAVLAGSAWVVNLLV
jgi:ribosomal protein L7/L12